MKKILLIMVVIVFSSCEKEEINNYYYGDGDQPCHHCPDPDDPNPEPNDPDPDPDLPATQVISWAASQTFVANDSIVYRIGITILSNDKIARNDLDFLLKVRFSNYWEIRDLHDYNFQYFGKEDYLPTENYPTTDYQYVYHTVSVGEQGIFVGPLQNPYQYQNPRVQLQEYAWGYIDGYQIPFDPHQYVNWGTIPEYGSRKI